MTPVERGKADLETLMSEHGMLEETARALASSLTQIGPEELGRMVFSSGTIEELRHLAQLTSEALAVADQMTFNASEMGAKT